MRSSCSTTLLAGVLAACAGPAPKPVAAAADTCTQCGEPQLVPVIYGMLDAQGIARVERGEVVSGGCDARGPSHYCRACGHEHFARDLEMERQSREFAAKSEQLRRRHGR